MMPDLHVKKNDLQKPLRCCNEHEASARHRL